MNPTTSMRFATETEFTLPKGYLDTAGVLHRRGAMRLATAADEILPLRDPRVQQNPAYLAVIVLSRVIVKLGSLTDVDVKVIEGLYAGDFDYLQRLYEQFNAVEDSDGGTSLASLLPRLAGERVDAVGEV
ncbi:hypothetical protein B0G69_6429 [Paraburkholderia sp. RAU2J]|uniref:hypothetical protein n=1 Tax=Paraburkholderia sp. RAU2J TaxID=1938810 RepID=UPI000F2B7423|nr:hypothetical protein [Paraburkholderia sp. RAU2J]RKT13300.1 hypothetical protein B0G69_6429 [Paraburkholderia sp. RAU2J]